MSFKIGFIPVGFDSISVGKINSRTGNVDITPACSLLLISYVGRTLVE